MCFSATASFGAGIVLSVIGTLSIRKVKSPNQILFASIPFVFAIQQFSEGILWVSLPNPKYESLQTISMYTFLVFAQILWPLWVPISIYILKKDEKWKRLLQVCIVLGAITSIYLFYALLSFPVVAKIVEHHIVYVQDYPFSTHYYIATFYVLATIAPTFLSSVKRMWGLGILITISSIIAAFFYENYLVSIWCFFASIISSSVYLIVKGKGE